MTAGRRVRVAGLWAALAAALALVPAGCGRCGRPSETAAPVPAGAPVPTGEAAQARPKPALPEPGSAVVEVTERGVTVLANAAPLLEVLRLLEQQAGFRLILGRLRRPAPVTVWAMELPLEEVLSQLLEGHSYQNRYRADPERGGHVLAALAVGVLDTEGGAGVRNRLAQRRVRREQRQREQDARLARLSPEERERELERRAEERERREAERREERARVAREIEDADARVRAEAARGIETDAEGERLLRELLAGDPSPAVRAAAAQRLAMAESHQAGGALLQALGDPNPEVVMAVLEVLMFVGDQSMVPQVMNLRNHPNPGIRDAANRTLNAIQ